MLIYNIKDKKPSVGEIILAKLIPCCEQDEVIYYVFKVIDEDTLEEASGEQYWRMDMDDIIAWISLKEFDKMIIY